MKHGSTWIMMVALGFLVTTSVARDHGYDYCDSVVMIARWLCGR